MGVVHQAVEDGIGNCGVTDDVVPMLDRELAGDQCGPAAVASSPALFLLAALAAGCATSAIQIVVPVAASLVGEAHRGRIIGNVMSGLMIGIPLARPIASPSAAALVCAVGLGFVTLALGLASSGACRRRRVRRRTRMMRAPSLGPPIRSYRHEDFLGWRRGRYR